jgi:hypothetical protein
MKLIAVLLCGALAACSQTNSSHKEEAIAATPQKARPGTPQARATNCQDTVAKMQKQQTNAAMLGGALSMVGGLGGLGGRGGAIAAQAASYGGSVMQAKAQNDIQGAIEKECLS